MKLDESIELKNKNQNTTEMNKLENVTVSDIRTFMHELMVNEDTNGAFYNVLHEEGFLIEGIDNKAATDLLMEDDDLVLEMFKACANNLSENGEAVQKVVDSYFSGLTEPLNETVVMENAIGIYNNLLENGNDPKQILDFIVSECLTPVDALAIMELINSRLDENKLPAFTPIKGKNVDADNKANSTKDDHDEVKDAEKTQETTEEKVDNLKNQKYSPNMENGYQKQLKNFHLGFKNALNYDYTNDVSDDYKKRVELEVTTGHSRERDESVVGKEANVDHESTKRTGEAMIAASQENQKFADEDYQSNPILTTNEPYERTSVTGNKYAAGNKHIFKDKKVNEELEKMKKMFGYEQTEIEANKKNAMNEDDILYNSVSTKKPI